KKGVKRGVLGGDLRGKEFYPPRSPDKTAKKQRLKEKTLI
ncbi:unnamed protein product, partial [marine sediment metagenome]